MERLQKIIAQSGYCSRRKAEELILAGKVKVDGVITKELGTKVDYDSKISINGVSIAREEKAVYILNKPKNVISSVSDEKGRETVCDLIDSPYRLYPVGRLDYDSSGLLIMTNDGDLAQNLLHPKYEVEKVYEVTINGLITKAEITRLENGVKIDNYLTAPSKITFIRANENKKTSYLLVTIHEGKNREIRRMFEKFGYKVIRLNRIKEANLELGNLRPGEYRKLKPFELVQLKKYLNGDDR